MLPRPVALMLAIPVAFAGVDADQVDEDPLRFLEPVVTLDPAERALLRTGETVVAVLPGRDGHVSVSAIVRVAAPADRLVAWARDIEQQQGRYVEAIGRFSQPPQIGDLEDLTFEEQDLEDLAECRPGRCDVKLSASEIMALRRLEGPDRNTCLEAALRRMLVQRATTYLHGGDTAADPYADDDEPVVPAEVFASLLQRMEFLPRRFPGIADYVQRFPQMRDPHVIDSFLHWSKETLGVKPIVNVTHLTIARFEPGAMPEVMIVAKQVFANHYKNGSITLTAMSGDGSDRYLIYVQRAHVDVLRGIFGGVARRLLERRVKAEAPAVLLALRDRLERIPIETR